MHPKRDYFHSFQLKQPTISTVVQRKNNKAADSVTSFLIFHCILAG